MVWGMQMPDSFGKYFISGTFEFADDPTGAESWSERLEMYYRVGMPENEKSKFQRQGEKYGAMTYKSFVLYKFIDEHGVEPDPHTPPLTAIEEAEAPKWFSAEKSHRMLGDIVELVDRIKVVSGKMRDIVERFEPGAHQFFPIEIRLPNGSVFPEPYYTLAVRNWRDSVIAKPEMLDPAFQQLEKISPRSYLTQLSSFRKLRFGRGDIQDGHLWCERFFGEKLLCFSDALMQAFTEAGLDLPTAQHLAEEGDAWRKD